MKITFIPQRNDTTLVLERVGDILTINGDVFDFSAIPEGATLPQGAISSDWIAGDVTREGGVLIVPLLLPHGANAPDETLFPAPITLTADGPVDLPAHSIEEPEL